MGCFTLTRLCRVGSIALTDSDALVPIVPYSDFTYPKGKVFNQNNFANTPSMSLESGNSDKPKSLRILPDPAICRAKESENYGMINCLVSDAHDCKHMVLHKSKQFCFSPRTADILERTKLC
jgi:hypothetical protein